MLTYQGRLALCRRPALGSFCGTRKLHNSGPSQDGFACAAGREVTSVNGNAGVIPQGRTN